MAHNLSQTRNASGDFYSLRVPAWHRLGTVVDVPADDDRVMQLAGLDWEPIIRPLFATSADGDPIAITSHRSVLRGDNGAPLGVVGPDYTLAGNRSLLDALRRIDDAQGATIETAGVLGAGEAVFLSARVDSLAFAIGEDGHHGYLLISNRHDGKQTLRVTMTSVRVVCQNTLGLALRNARGEGHYLRHTAGIGDALRGVADQYRSALDAYRAQRTALRALANKLATPQTFETIMRAAWDVSAESLKDEGDRARTIRQNRERALARIRRGPTCDVVGTAGTLFSDFQAITEYVDHDDASAEGALYAVQGAGAKVKDRALSAALALV